MANFFEVGAAKPSDPPVIFQQPQQRRRLEALAQELSREGTSTAPVQHWLQAAARIAQAGAGAYVGRKLDDEQQAMTRQQAEQLAKILARGSGNRGDNGVPPGEFETSGGEDQGRRRDLAAMLMGNPDLIPYAQAAYAKRAFGETERYEPVKDDQGNVIGQRSTLSGRVVDYPRQDQQEQYEPVKDAQGRIIGQRSTLSGRVVDYPNGENGGTRLTPAQTANNAEIDQARAILAQRNLSPDDVRRLSQSATNTGRPNNEYEEYLRNVVTKATSRKTGDDPEFSGVYSKYLGGPQPVPSLDEMAGFGGEPPPSPFALNEGQPPPPQRRPAVTGLGETPLGAGPAAAKPHQRGVRNIGETTTQPNLVRSPRARETRGTAKPITEMGVDELAVTLERNNLTPAERQAIDMRLKALGY